MASATWSVHLHPVTPGARTPEDLDALLEDAFVVRDPDAVAAMFEATAVVVGGDGFGQARGVEQISRLVMLMWQHERIYLSQPQGVVQTRDTALVLGDRALSVMRRDSDGMWRYAIWVASLEAITPKEET